MSGRGGPSILDGVDVLFRSAVLSRVAKVADAVRQMEVHHPVGWKTILETSEKTLIYSRRIYHLLDHGAAVSEGRRMAQEGLRIVKLERQGLNLNGRGVQMGQSTCRDGCRSVGGGYGRATTLSDPERAYSKDVMVEEGRPDGSTSDSGTCSTC